MLRAQDRLLLSRGRELCALNGEGKFISSPPQLVGEEKGGGLEPEEIGTDTSYLKEDYNNQITKA